MNLLPMIIEVVGGLIFEIQVWQYTVCTLIFIWKFNVSPPPPPQLYTMAKVAISIMWQHVVLIIRVLLR